MAATSLLVCLSLYFSSGSTPPGAGNNSAVERPVPTILKTEHVLGKWDETWDTDNYYAEYFSDMKVWWRGKKTGRHYWGTWKIDPTLKNCIKSEWTDGDIEGCSRVDVEGKNYNLFTDYFGQVVIMRRRK